MIPTNPPLPKVDVCDWGDETSSSFPSLLSTATRAEVLNIFKHPACYNPLILGRRKGEDILVTHLL